MSKIFYTRLQLKIDGKSILPEGKDAVGQFSPQFVQRYSYKVTITPNQSFAGESVKKFEGKFDAKSLRSADHKFNTSSDALDTLAEAQAGCKVVWDILFDGKINHSYVGKLFSEPQNSSKECSEFNIKFTNHRTLPSDQGHHNVTVQHISQGVGWYLMRQEESFGALVRRAFKNPTQHDWDAMKHVNQHLGNLSTVTLLKPGQVVIFSRTKKSTHPKLAQMIAAAKPAQAAWKKAMADDKIDATEMLLLDLLMQGHQPIEIAPDQVQGLVKEKGLAVIDDYKKYIDGTFGLAGANFEQAANAQAKLAQIGNDINYTTAKGTAKRAVKAAAQAYPKEFRLLNESSLARKLVRWDTGIQANRARDYVQHAVRLRSAASNGGIQNVATNLGNVGKYSKILKRVGYVGIAIEAGSTVVSAQDAYSRGDIKGGNVEVGKGVGSIALGAGAGAASVYVLTFIFGVATGGVGLVLLGVAAAVVGYAGSELGKKAGEGTAGLVNDLVLKP
jgi:hypothetical protein